MNSTARKGRLHVAGLIVVGAGPGIGLSVARQFAGIGMSVCAIARRRETLATVSVALAPHGVAVSCHVADAGRTDELQGALRAAINEHGVPEVVVYNAGVIQADSPGDLSPAEQTRAWSVNVLGALTTAVETMPLMAERGSGTFLITGGMPVPVASYLSLSLGKASVRTLTTMLAEHYAPHGVHAATVTVAGAVAPGTAFDPDAIAEHYLRLHAQPPNQWQTELLFDGAS
jgi:NAD(P)-dependent dehydrogenase (short-subunit alcohol dehydrogenase family)